MMNIDLETHKTGRVQWLSICEQPEHRLISVGCLLPGNYPFGSLACNLTVTVTSGIMDINGQTVKSGDLPVTIKAGEHVQVSAEEPATFLCQWGSK